MLRLWLAKGWQRAEAAGQCFLWAAEWAKARYTGGVGCRLHVMPEFPITERSLRVVHRNGREAMARVRTYTFGRELRISVGGHTVFRRLLTTREDEDRVSADTRSCSR